MNTSNQGDERLIIGHEYPQPGEEETAAYIVKLLKSEMDKLYPAGEGKRQLRQIHPKMNGCLKAEFIVEPGLHDDLRVGLFKEAKSFPCWVRLSNGNTRPVPDYKKDFRGFAIKVMNVPGKKLDSVHPDISNHDFILMNTKNFLSGDVRKFGDVLYVTTTPFKLSTLAKKLGIAFSNLPVIIKAAKAKVKINHPCEIPYFSTVPFRFGDETRAVKYAVLPSASNKLLTPDTTGNDMLRMNLSATLKQNEIRYDFCIQFQTDPVMMPVENPEIIWTSPFIKLATIRIPVQEFDTPERNEFGDNLAFNVWHCLPEHRPLGSFNRVRKLIYEDMYEYRHRQNKVTGTEPVAGPDFFNDTK